MRRCLQLLLTFLLLGSGAVQSQINKKGKDPVANPPLPGIEINIENNEDFTAFSVLDSSVKKFRVFFTGEDHTFTSSNIKLELKMLRYLHKNAGARIHLLEFGSSVGWLVDKYVQTGDTTYLTDLKDYSYNDFSDLFKGLREFNKGLDSANKIHVVGIDLEWSVATACKVIRRLMNDSIKPSDSIALSMETIKGLSKYSSITYMGKSYFSGLPNYYSENYNTKASMEAVVEMYYRHKADFIKCIPKDPEMLERIMNGVREFSKWNEYEMKQMMQGTYYREQYMYEKFAEALRKFPDGVFYGQFGRCHTAKEEQDKWCTGYDFNSVSSRINNAADPRLRDKVCTFGIYYPNSGFNIYYGGDEQRLWQLFRDSKKEGVYLHPVAADTVIANIATNRFQYIIVNYSLPGEKFLKVGKSDYTAPKYPINSYYNFDGFYGYLWFNPWELNDHIATKGLPSFPDHIAYSGGGFTLSENRFQTILLHLGYYFPTKVQNDSISASLQGFQIKFVGGPELLRKNWLQFSPYAGIGISNFSLTIKNIDTTATGFFGEPNRITYTNPGFLLEAGLDLRFNFRFFSIGARGGYQFDLSQQQWRSGNAYVAPDVRTGHSGAYAAVNVSLFFID